MTTKPTEEQRVAAIAEELCHVYHYGVGMAELEEADPDQARAHRRAARRFLRWLDDYPEQQVGQERRAAFRRGYDRGAENAKKAAAEQMVRLEAEVTELRQDRDPEGLRARIADLQYVNRGWGRLMQGTTPGQSETADLLGRLEAAQRELAVLKGVQPSNATGDRPS